MSDEAIRIWCVEEALKVLSTQPDAALAFAEELFAYVMTGQLTAKAQRMRQSRDTVAA